MRRAIRVDCIDRSARGSPYHRIRAIGGLGPDGLRWRLSEDAAIAALDEERVAFYIERPMGHRVEIVPAQGLGKRYIKTESDGESPDCLLELPDCD
jgi:hypothetical protein